jgi:hypothetical protein
MDVVELKIDNMLDAVAKITMGRRSSAGGVSQEQQGDSAYGSEEDISHRGSLHDLIYLINMLRAMRECASILVNDCVIRSD